jgi:abortive infection bacteriophage resistance protein
MSPQEFLNHGYYLLNYVRNVCAHHGRLWNIRLRIKPLLPKGIAYEEWVKPVKILNDKMFGILNFLTKQIDIDYRFKDQLKSLLQRYPLIPSSWIGFPVDWEESPLWAENSDDDIGR